MADNASNNLRTDLEKQIAELKNEIANMGKSIKGRASEAVDSVDDVFTNTRDKARGATKQIRQQANIVSNAIRENPGTATTVLSSVGLIGLIVGVAVGCAITSGHSSHKHFGRY